MKRFKFRLQRVLDYRNAVKREHEMELMERNKQLRDTEECVNMILEAQNNVKKAEAGQETTMAEVALELTYTAALQEALIHQRLLVIEATQAVEQARDRYIEKAIEAETLTTLKRKKEEEHREEARKHERKEMDNLVVLRHRLKKGNFGPGGNNE